MKDIITLLALVIFIFLGFMVTIIRERILRGLRDGIKKKSLKDCDCNGNCNCSQEMCCGGTCECKK